VNSAGAAPPDVCLAVIDPASKLTVMYAQHLLNNQEPYVHPRLKNIIYACL